MCKWHEGFQKEVDECVSHWYPNVSHWYPSVGMKPCSYLLQGACVCRGERVCKALYVGVHARIRADRCWRALEDAQDGVP